MTTRMLLSGVTVATAALALTLGGAGTTLAEPAQPATTATTASQADDRDVRKHTRYGSGEFEAYGEHLYAHDTRKDGIGVVSQLKWGGAVQETVKDKNGADPGRGHRNLKITEGTKVKLRLCFTDDEGNNKGCTGWKAGRA